MSLRVKLIITYAIMLVLSIVIIVFSGVGLVTSAIHDSARTLIGDQTVEEAFNKVVDVIVDLRYTQKYHPETLSQDVFASDIAKQISVFNGFLVVKNDGKYKAYGIENADMNLYSLIEENEKNREDYSARHGLNLNSKRITWNGMEYGIMQYEFPDTPSGLNYYFLVKMENAKNAIGHYNGILFVGLIMLTVIVIAPLLWIITRDIVMPLKKLENCAREIAMGNLNFNLDSKSNNEIGRVIRSYEKMRYELKKSIDSQLEMEENRKQLLSNITHDLKTPITSIKGYIQGIRDGVANDPDKLAKYLNVIYTKSVDMNAMIDDLFLFSKLDLRKEPFNKDFVDIDDFYNSCIQELNLELGGKGVELTSECHIAKGLKVFMDSQKIKRVILNIVGNSMKFMDKDNKQLNIDFLEQEGSLTVKIRDNGIGIDQKELDKIFERFYRTDPSRNGNTGGTGLGLAIAKQIIEQHNGTIMAGSVKGEWTEISLKIPVGSVSETIKQSES
jgi:Signal transduction histidine kinase